jgi:hypothetical protein
MLRFASYILLLALACSRAHAQPRAHTSPAGGGNEGQGGGGGGDNKKMSDEDMVKWMEENPEKLDEIMSDMGHEMKEEHMLAGHARQVALISAARTGNLEDIRFALREGCKITDRSEHNETVLHLSAQWGHPDAVKHFLDEGADPNLPDGGGQSALALAAHWGEKAALKHLLEAGANVNHQTPEGQSALHAVVFGNRASKADEIEIINLLLDAGIDHNLSYKKEARTHHAGMRAIGVAKQHKKDHLVEHMTKRLNLGKDEL